MSKPLAIFKVWFCPEVTHITSAHILLAKPITWACLSPTDWECMLNECFWIWRQSATVPLVLGSVVTGEARLGSVQEHCHVAPPKSEPGALTSFTLGFLIRGKWVEILVLIKNSWPLAKEVRGRQIHEKSSILQAECEQRPYFGMKGHILWGRKKQMNILCYYVSQTSRYKWVGQVQISQKCLAYRCTNIDSLVIHSAKSNYKNDHGPGSLALYFNTLITNPCTHSRLCSKLIFEKPFNQLYILELHLPFPLPSRFMYILFCFYILCS